MFLQRGQLHYMCGERAGHTHFFRAFAIILSGQNGNEIAHIPKQYEKIVGKNSTKEKQHKFMLLNYENYIQRQENCGEGWFDNK